MVVLKGIFLVLMYRAMRLPAGSFTRQQNIWWGSGMNQLNLSCNAVLAVAYNV